MIFIAKFCGVPYVNSYSPDNGFSVSEISLRERSSITSAGLVKFWTPPPVSARSAQVLTPHPPSFAAVILEQEVSCLTTYTTRFKLSKYAF